MYQNKNEAKAIVYLYRKYTFKLILSEFMRKLCMFEVSTDLCIFKENNVEYYSITAQQLKLQDIKSKYLAKEKLANEEERLVNLLAVGGKDLLPYAEGALLELLQIIVSPTQVKEMLSFKMYPVIKGKERRIVNVTAYAQALGCSTQAVTKELKQKGYKIKYDRNRLMDKNRVITYIEV